MIIREQAPIFLTGFSGVGKSSVGKALSFKLGRQFFDLDAEVELLGGAKIATLIERQGEAAFRKLESQILNSLALTRDSVVALGGGSLMNAQSLQRVKEQGCLIFMEDTFENLQKHLAGQRDRPLIKENSLQELESLMRAREDGYRASHETVPVLNLTIPEACDAVERAYQRWLNPPN